MLNIQRPITIQIGIVDLFIEMIVGNLLDLLFQVEVKGGVDVIATVIQVLRPNEGNEDLVNDVAHKMRGLDALVIGMGGKSVLPHLCFCRTRLA